MGPDEYSSIAQDFIRFLSESMHLYPSTDEREALEVKIEILEKFIQMVRYEANYVQNSLRFEDFVHFQIFIDDLDRRVSVDRSQPESASEDIEIMRHNNAEQLQTPLLIFLLLHYQNQRRVLETIESFIEEIHPSLTPRDFEKTQTGAVRCFTNTRFAANRLREHGLLRFTETEAYKVWDLSLLGILVALQLYTSTWRDYPPGAKEREPSYPKISDALIRLGDTETVRKILYSVCQERDSYSSFDLIIASMEELAKAYRHDENDRQRIKSITNKILTLLDEAPWMEQFKEDLALKMQTEEWMDLVQSWLNPE